MTPTNRVATAVSATEADAQNRVSPPAAQRETPDEKSENPALEPESAAEHIRNAMQLLESCAISPNAGYRLYSADDLAAIRRRLNRALERLEESALPDGASFELTELGAAALADGRARDWWLASGLRAVARLSSLCVLVASISCGALDAIGPKPPAKVCPARDTVRLDSMPSTIRIVRGCP